VRCAATDMRTPEDEPSRWWSLVPLVAVLVAYGGGLHNGWHFDDHHSILENECIRTTANVPRFFTDPTTFSGRHDLGEPLMYRPLLLTNYALQYALTGYDLPSWHGVQLMLHLMMVWLVYALARRLGCDYRGSTMAATLFACHPLNSQAVNYLSCRSEIQASVFSLAAVVLAWRRDDDGDRWAMPAAATALLAALLTKSIAVVVPCLVVLGDVLVQRRSVAAACRRVVPLVVVAGLYLALRVALLGHVALPPTDDPTKPGLRLFTDNPVPFARAAIGGRSVATNLALQAVVVVEYLSLFARPWALSPIHAIDTTGRPSVWPEGAVVLALAVVTAVLLLRRHREPLVTYGWLFFLVTLIPTSLVPLNIVAAEHRCYLGSSVVFVLLATSTARCRPRRRIVVEGLLVVACVATTAWRTTVWRTEFSLWHDAVTKAPRARYVNVNYGSALLDAGFVERGVWHLERELALFPFRETKLPAILAANHRRLGNLVLAASYVKQALEASPHDAGLLELSADVADAAGRCDVALTMLAAASKAPGADVPRLHRSTEHVARRLDAAERQVALPCPTDEQGRMERAGALFCLGRCDEAMVLLEPLTGSASARRMLGELLLRVGRPADATVHLSAARRLGAADAAERLVVALGAAGRKAEARATAQSLLHAGNDLSLEARCFADLPPYAND